MSLSTPQKIRRFQRALYVNAKQDPGYRFYSLYDKLYREGILLYAYRLCWQKGGAAGMDGEGFADIEAYGLTRWLGEVQEGVRAGRYEPKPVHRVWIPKPGRVGQRPLGIPCIRDRVVQTAGKLIIEPIFEADFDEAAYGYRPGRSAVQAVERVHRALLDGRREVVDADLSSYFHTIPHWALMRSVARRICDRKMLKLIKRWLKAPVEQYDEQGRRRISGAKGSSRGTPQGGSSLRY